MIANSTEEAAPVVVAEFPKNKKETLRVSLVVFQGHELLEIRAYYPAADGELKPGKGLAIQRTQIIMLRKALQEAERQLKEGKKSALTPEQEPEESAEPLAEAA